MHAQARHPHSTTPPCSPQAPKGPEPEVPVPRREPDMPQFPPDVSGLHMRAAAGCCLDCQIQACKGGKCSHLNAGKVHLPPAQHPAAAAAAPALPATPHPPCRLCLCPHQSRRRSRRRQARCPSCQRRQSSSLAYPLRCPTGAAAKSTSHKRHPPFLADQWPFSCCCRCCSPSWMPAANSFSHIAG